MMRAFQYKIVLVIAVLLFALSQNALAGDKWLKIETPGFSLIGNADEKDLRQVAAKLENFHLNFQDSFKSIKFQTPFRTNVVVFRDKSSRGGYQAGNRSFIAADDTNYATVSMDSEEEFDEVLRDYTRFLLSNNVGQRHIPAWIYEGLVKYFADESLSNPLLSQPNNLIPLNDLFQIGYYSLQNQPDERKSIFSAQSAFLLSFLLSEKGNGQFENVEKLILQLRNGKTLRDSLTTIFQVNFSTLENEFRQSIGESKSQKRLTFNLKVKFDAKASSISDSEAFAYLGDYLFYTGQYRRAEKLLSKSLESNPKNSFAAITFSLLKAHQFYYDEAETLAKEAVENASDNPEIQYRYAKVLSRRGMTEYGFVSGYDRSSAAEMRIALRKAIELNPDFIASYGLLAFVNYVRNEELDESLKLIAKALKIAPENHFYLLRLAEINLRKENFLDARKSALDVLLSSSSEAVRLYAQNTIQRIDTTEFQLNRIRNDKTKYVDDDIVSDKPLSDEEIRKLREKATADQIRVSLRRPKSLEKRVLASLTKIECGKEKVDFVFKTQEGLLKLHAKSFDSVSLLSFIEEMSNFRLNCGRVSKENNASIIISDDGDGKSMSKIVSIEFVPLGFALKKQ